MNYKQRIQQLQMLKGTEEGFSALLEALKESDFRVRKTALELLYQSYPKDRIVKRLIEFLFLEDNAAARNTAIEALIAAGPEVLKELEKIFTTKNQDVRKFIVDIAGQLHSPLAISLLLRALKDEDENVRSAAVEYLGRFKAKEAVGPLIRLLQEDNLWVKFSVIEALGKIGTEDVVPLLIRALSDRTLTEVAIRALGNCKSSMVLQKIVPFIADRRRSVASEAIVCISKIVSTEEEAEMLKRQIEHFMSLDDFINRLKENIIRDRSETRIASIKLLGFLGGPQVIETLLTLIVEQDLAEVVFEALSRIGRRFPYALEAHLWRGFPEKRRFVARVMASLNLPIYYGSFMNALSDIDGHVVAVAARALSEMGDAQSVEKLIPLLGHPYPDVQEAAVEGIVSLGRYIQTDELKTLLQSPSESVRANAAIVAGRLKREALVEDLGLLSMDPSMTVRKAVAEALGEIGTADALQFLVRLLKDEETEVRIAALTAVSGEAPTWIIKEVELLINDPVPGVRVAAIRTLSRFKTEDAKRILEGLLTDKDPYIIVHVIEALKEDLSPHITKTLRSFLEHPDKEVKRTTIEALSLKVDEEKLLPYLLSEDWSIRLAAVKALSRYHSRTSIRALRELYQVEQDSLIRNTIKGLLDVSG